MQGRPLLAPGAASAGDAYTPRRGDLRFRTERYELELSYRTSTNRLEGRATLHVVARADTDRLALDLGALRVTKVLAGKQPARFVHRMGKLHIILPAPMRMGERIALQVTYAGNPRPIASRWGTVGWEELTDGALVAGQPDGASSWFPCNDHPADKASYRLSIAVESGYEVVASGVLTSTKRAASTTTWVFEQHEPMATYLATVQIGRYDRHPLAHAPVPVELVAPSRCVAAARADLARQIEILDVFVDRFGPYPFPSYTVVVTDDPLEIPLEAQGLSIFGSNHLDGSGSSERLVAHELAHQWFGNMVTVAAWQHIWLQEGFACYAEWIWSEASGGPTADALAREHHAVLAVAPQDLVLSDPGPDDMFDDRVYKRGALVLHVLRQALGDEAFFNLLRTWLAEHRYANATTDDFLAAVAAGRGAELAGSLEPWLHDPALPSLPR